jgi:hypothetical protein
MLFNEVLDGIETILKADADTKDVIKEYRQYIVEQGIRATPFCLLGVRVKAIPEIYDIDGKLQTWDGDVSIMLLGQSYDVPSRHQAMIDTLDKLQSDVYNALITDTTLNNSVIESKIDEVKSTGFVFDIYFGFEIKLSIRKKA